MNEISLVHWRKLWTLLVSLVVILTIKATNAVSTDFPYGQANPDAPAELQQFDFLIGEFNRRERIRNRDGSWGSWQKGEWNARYFMNGPGIIDATRNFETGIVTENTRIYDEQENIWKVIWIRLPDYSTLLAEGGKDGDGMTLVNVATNDRWVFSDITETGYLWTLTIEIQGEYVPVREIETTRKA